MPLGGFGGGGGGFGGGHQGGSNQGKVNKPCRYFNMPGGCKLGDNCKFLHQAQGAGGGGGCAFTLERFILSSNLCSLTSFSDFLLTSKGCFKTDLINVE